MCGCPLYPPGHPLIIRVLNKKKLSRPEMRFVIRLKSVAIRLIRWISPTLDSLFFSTLQFHSLPETRETCLTAREDSTRLRPVPAPQAWPPVLRRSVDSV